MESLSEPPNCRVYAAGSNWCDLCNDGYYAFNGVCNVCHAKCINCDAYERCTSCVSGLVLTDGYCCDLNCLSCNHNTCWQCKPGFSWVSGRCQ